MKATWFAVLFSLVMSCPVQATEVVTSPPSATKQAQTKINLNSANVQQLTNSFKGIGHKRAQAIVTYRATHGQFKSIDDLAGVRGIGRQFVKKNLLKLQQLFTVG